MRSRQLECFVRVCELGSITKAAATLNIAQPALGAQIKALERELGVRLLARTVTGTSPTRAGSVFLEEAKFILRRLENLKRTLREVDANMPRTLRVGMPASLTGMLASRLLERVHVSMPDLTVKIVENPSHVLVEQMQNGKLDIGLAFAVPPNPAIHGEPRLRETLYLITNPGSPFDRNRPIPLREIVSIDLTMPGEGDVVRQLVDDTLQRHKLALRVAYPVDSMPAMKDVVARGLACAILPSSAVAREVQDRTLIARPITRPSISRILFIIRPADAAPNEMSRSLYEIVGQLLLDLCRESKAFELL
jgi:LysR family nitrogen assimilation transcriptional regulator